MYWLGWMGQSSLSLNPPLITCSYSVGGEVRDTPQKVQSRSFSPCLPTLQHTLLHLQVIASTPQPLDMIIPEHQRKENTADAADAVATVQPTQGAIHESVAVASMSQPLEMHTEITSALLPPGVDLATDARGEMHTITSARPKPSPHFVAPTTTATGRAGGAPSPARIPAKVIVNMIP